MGGCLWWGGVDEGIAPKVQHYVFTVTLNPDAQQAALPVTQTNPGAERHASPTSFQALSQTISSTVSYAEDMQRALNEREQRAAMLQDQVRRGAKAVGGRGARAESARAGVDYNVEETRPCTNGSGPTTPPTKGSSSYDSTPTNSTLFSG